MFPLTPYKCQAKPEHIGARICTKLYYYAKLDSSKYTKDNQVLIVVKGKSIFLQ